MNSDEKLAAFKALLEDDALAQRVLTEAQKSEKTADTLGIAFKEKVDLNALSEDDLLEIAIARKEAAMKKGDEDAKKMDDGEEEEEKKPDPTAEFKAMMSEMKGYMAQMEKMFGQREKEAGAVSAVQEASQLQSARIVQLEGQIATLASQLKELKGDVPAGILNGKRPSQAQETVIEGLDAEAQKALNGADPYGTFLDSFMGLG